jgi:hypothetical protein
VAVINTHTFSQADFDAVGEVLLCPRQIGLLELPKSWVNQIRSVFNSEEDRILDAPSRVTFQKLNDGSFVVHNYNQEKATVEISLPKETSMEDGFTGQTLEISNNILKLEMQPRSRIWLIPGGSIKKVK